MFIILTTRHLNFIMIKKTSNQVFFVNKMWQILDKIVIFKFYFIMVDFFNIIFLVNCRLKPF